MAKLTNWFVFGDSLIGDVTEHPRQHEFSTRHVRTSSIKGKRGDKVVTRSGTEYELTDQMGDKAALLAGLSEV